MSSKLVSFWSVRHRVGTSTLALSTALYLARNTESRVLLVDSTAYGDLENILDFKSKQSLSSLLSLASIDSLTSESVESACIKLESGLFVLPSVDLKSGYIENRRDEFLELISLCKEYFDIIVADTNSGLSSVVSVGLLDRSDIVVNVVEQDSLVLNSFINSRTLAPAKKSVITVINKYSEEVFPSSKDIARDIECEDIINVPYSEELRIAFNSNNIQKFSLNMPGDFARPIKKLASYLVAVDDKNSAEPTGLKGLFSKLRR